MRCASGMHSRKQLAKPLQVACEAIHILAPCHTIPLSHTLCSGGTRAFPQEGTYARPARPPGGTDMSETDATGTPEDATISPRKIDFNTATEEEITEHVITSLDRLSAEGLTAVIEAAQDRRRERQEKV